MRVANSSGDGVTMVCVTNYYATMLCYPMLLIFHVRFRFSHFSAAI